MDETAKTPEWMLLLENKKKKPHRLAHEIGAGAPCLTCGDKCPGLDLHFWRKLCRNCKCKKEEHDVRDDEGYEQFEILFANSVTGKKKRTGAFLNIKVPEALKSVPNPCGGSVVGGPNCVGNKSVAFDWVPPDVSEDLAAEYMQQLPPSKLPISGSDGALFRRQQLEIQVPLHDLDASKCHGLTPDEIQGLQQYLENVKNNVVGQGRVTKIPVPVLYAEQRVPYSGPAQSQSVTMAHSSVTGECKPIRIASSQSAQSLKSMSSFPMPRPFTPHIHGKNYQDNIPPPLLHDSLSSGAANLGLKTPSAFFPSQQHVGHTDAQLAIDHQAHYLASCTALSSKQDVQYSTKLPGRDVAQTVGSISSLESVTDEKQFMNMPVYAEAPVGQPVQILTYARDGTFVTDQQTHEIAYSTQMPVGLISQESKALDIPREASGPTGKKHEFPSGSSIEGDILDKSKQISRDGVITASRHPAGISFSEEMKTENTQSAERISDLLHTYDPAFQHRYSSTVQNPEYGAESVKGLSEKVEHPSLQQGEVSGTTCLQGVSSEQSAYNVADSLSGQQQKSSPYSFPTKNGVHDIPKDFSAPEYQNSVPRSLQAGQSGVSPQDATFLPCSTNVVGHIVHSVPIGGDSMPKSAHVMQQSHVAEHTEPDQEAVEHELAGKLQQLTDLGGGSSQHEASHLECHKCSEALLAGDVAVFAERAGKQAAWHPQCFVCCTCEELLVDLIYFYHNGEVYCGRHYAQLLNIPRCFACDELIFVKEYTCAEGKAFHFRHFCCYECDIPLGGKQYIPKDDQPVCLECFQDKYGKKCHTCKLKIAAGDPRVGWKDLSWHVSPDCFCCFQCSKSLLGGKFMVKNEQPFCSKECFQNTVQI